MFSVSGIKAGNAFVIIEAVDATSRVLDRVAMKMRNWSSNMTRIGLATTAAATLGATAFASSLNVYTKFDDQMKKVEARTIGTTDEMKALREQAKSAGIEIGYTAFEIASLMDKLGQKGFNRSQILKMTPHVAALARAGGEGGQEDAPQVAADLIGGTLKAFQMDASESARVAHVMATAVNQSNFTLMDLVTAMQTAGTIANEYNISLEETVALLSQLADVNIEAASQGYAFRNIALYLSDASARDKFNEDMKKMGVNTIEFVDRFGNLRPLPKLLFEIGDATKNLGTAIKGNIFDELFGKRAIVPAQVLGRSENPFKNMLGMLSEGAGAHIETAKTMESGIGGALRKIKLGLESLNISIQEALDKGIQALAGKVTFLLRSLSGWVALNPLLAGQVAGLIPLTFLLGVGFIALGMAGKLTVTSLALLSSVIGIVNFGFGTLRTAIAIITPLFSGLITVASYAAQGLWFLSNPLSIIARTLVGILAIGLLASSRGFVALAKNMPLIVIYSLRLIDHFFVLSVVLGRNLAIATYRFATSFFTASTVVAKSTALIVRQSSTAISTINRLGEALANLPKTIITLLSVTTNTFKNIPSLFSSLLGLVLSLLSPTGIFIALLVSIGILLYANRDTIFSYMSQALGTAKQKLNDLWGTTKQMFIDLGMRVLYYGKQLYQVYTDAMEALQLGDTDLAWKIATTGLKIIWLEVIDDLKAIWDDFIQYIKNNTPFDEILEGIKEFLPSTGTNTAQELEGQDLVVSDPQEIRRLGSKNLVTGSQQKDQFNAIYNQGAFQRKRADEIWNSQELNDLIAKENQTIEDFNRVQELTTKWRQWDAAAKESMAAALRVAQGKDPFPQAEKEREANPEIKKLRDEMEKHRSSLDELRKKQEEKSASARDMEEKMQKQMEAFNLEEAILQLEASVHEPVSKKNIIVPANMALDMETAETAKQLQEMLGLTEHSEDDSEKGILRNILKESDEMNNNLRRIEERMGVV